MEGRLKFESSCNAVPRQLSIIQLLDLIDATDEGVGNSRASILAYMHVWRILVVVDLWNGETWRFEVDVHGLFRGNHHFGPLTIQPMLEFLGTVRGLTSRGINLINWLAEVGLVLLLCVTPSFCQWMIGGYWWTDPPTT